MTALLEEMGRASRERAETAMRERPLFDLEALIETLPPPRKFAARVSRAAGPAPRMIAAMMRCSPGAGVLRPTYRPRQIAMGYARIGVAALCVATEPDRFGGHIDHISEARPAHLPILRDDFLVTPYQVAQSRVAGADAVLLKAALLAGASLGIMIHAARRYGVDALVEVEEADDVVRAIDAGTGLFAVHHGEGGTTRIDPDRGIRLLSRIPAGAVRIAGGGISDRSDVDRFREAGYDALLVGEPLMKAEDPADALWALMQPPA